MKKRLICNWIGNAQSRCENMRSKVNEAWEKALQSLSINDLEYANKLTEKANIYYEKIIKINNQYYGNLVMATVGEA